DPPSCARKGSNGAPRHRAAPFAGFPARPGSTSERMRLEAARTGSPGGGAPGSAVLSADTDRQDRPVDTFQGRAVSFGDPGARERAAGSGRLRQLLGKDEITRLSLGLQARRDVDRLAEVVEHAVRGDRKAWACVNAQLQIDVLG